MIFKNLQKLYLLIIFIVSWQLVSFYNFVPSVFLPSPLQTIIALKDGIFHGNWIGLFYQTTKHMFIGWLMASFLGVAIGGIIGISKFANIYIQPFLEFLRPLPASAIIPIGIAFLGLSEGMVYTVVVFGSIWPIVLSTVHAFKNIEPRLLEVRKILKINNLQFFLKIALPSALPDILSGMQISLSVALILAVTAEMLAYQQGLGTAILDAARSYRSPDLYAGVIILSFVGLISAQILNIFKSKLTQWR
jgi:sulfonate transport system permease protein